jgi:hypothetical protein
MSNYTEGKFQKGMEEVKSQIESLYADIENKMEGYSAIKNHPILLTEPNNSIFLNPFIYPIFQ